MPDVGRNRGGTDEILEAADRIFGRDGLGASMREIAREAGVADAVLYRRFPTRDDLVFRLLADDERKLRRQIEEGTALGHPEGILFGWLSEVNRFLLRYRGLAEAVLRGLATPDSPWAPFATRLVDFTRQHVELARSNGSCRRGIWPREMLIISVSLVSAGECVRPFWEDGVREPVNDVEVDRWLRLVLAGFEQP
ncbi:TetR family transcriptional regulator [Aurantimonas aggregata]|uniref:TetR family transcriptional regulator n=1 Tax=Aurantimonas aggregata TaxID=2047720 RepID=A0A6L9MNH3_9HYPH|nr:TetR/AcrR family transcriptional regulator [Aurantimonas aggregata]NDV89331.1 TetR family transcriptional regulator [Aurantimonas aggregata]